MNYNEKEFRSVQDEQETLDDDQKKQIEKIQEDNKDILDKIKNALGDEVASVKISTRLKSHPVCISSEGDISLEMERVINSMPNGEKIFARRVLELNPDHDVFKTLAGLSDDEISSYAKILYNQALLLEGMEIKDPAEFASLISKLMIK
jgi:molecular chaperone HtpG